MIKSIMMVSRLSQIHLKNVTTVNKSFMNHDLCQATPCPKQASWSIKTTAQLESESQDWRHQAPGWTTTQHTLT